MKATNADQIIPINIRIQLGPNTVSTGTAFTASLADIDAVMNPPMMCHNDVK